VTWCAPGPVGCPTTPADRQQPLLRMALEYTKIFGIPVIDHCEGQESERLGSCTRGTSRPSSAQGIPGRRRRWPWPRTWPWRDDQGAAAPGSHQHARQPGEGSGREAGRIAVTCEVSRTTWSYREAVADSDYDPNTKMSPPLRSGRRPAGPDRGAHGRQRSTRSPRTTPPHHADEKLVEFDVAPFGVIGLETTVPLILDRFVRPGAAHPGPFRRALSLNPARILGIRKGDAPGRRGRRRHAPRSRLERTVDVSRFQSSRATARPRPLLRGWPVANRGRRPHRHELVRPRPAESMRAFSFGPARSAFRAAALRRGGSLRTPGDLRPSARLSRPPRPAHEDVVLIVVGHAARRPPGPYGYERGTTPRLDLLARQGTVFDAAWSAAPWTLPSVMSI